MEDKNPLSYTVNALVAYDLMMTLSTFSALLAMFAVNSPVTSEFPAQRPVTRSFDVSFYLRLNKRLSKQPWDTIASIMTSL